MSTVKNGGLKTKEQVGSATDTRKPKPISNFDVKIDYVAPTREEFERGRAAKGAKPTEQDSKRKAKTATSQPQDTGHEIRDTKLTDTDASSAASTADSDVARLLPPPGTDSSSISLGSGDLMPAGGTIEDSVVPRSPDDLESAEDGQELQIPDPSAESGEIVRSVDIVEVRTEPRIADKEATDEVDENAVTGRIMLPPQMSDSSLQDLNDLADAAKKGNGDNVRGELPGVLDAAYWPPACAHGERRESEPILESPRQPDVTMKPYRDETCTASLTLQQVTANGSGGYTDVGIPVEFRQRIIKIGKLDSFHIRVNDATVSRIHALIELDTSSAQPSAKIVDLDYKSGTYVNNNRILLSDLKQGDIIRIGGAMFKVTNIRKVIDTHWVVNAPKPEVGGSNLAGTAFADQVIEMEALNFVKRYASMWTAEGRAARKVAKKMIKELTKPPARPPALASPGQAEQAESGIPTALISPAKITPPNTTPRQKKKNGLPPFAKQILATAGLVAAVLGGIYTMGKLARPSQTILTTQKQKDVRVISPDTSPVPKDAGPANMSPQKPDANPMPDRRPTPDTRRPEDTVTRRTYSRSTRINRIRRDGSRQTEVEAAYRPMSIERFAAIYPGIGYKLDKIFSDLKLSMLTVSFRYNTASSKWEMKITPVADHAAEQIKKHRELGASYDKWVKIRDPSGTAPPKGNYTITIQRW